MHSLRDVSRRALAPSYALAVAAVLLLGRRQAAAAQDPVAQASATPNPSASATIVVPPVNVISTTPLQGGGIDPSKVPTGVNRITSDDLQRTRSSNVLETLGQRLPGSRLSDVQGNPFQEDFRYRGFAASPLQGTPQGIAVYQNGIRLNEPFGDTVNWDLIPPAAIDHADLWSSNPVFGLNALGGALSIEMKNGFTWQGTQVDLQGGSYGNYGGTVQYGMQNGGFAAYVAVDGLNDDGWRYRSPSNVARFYVDAGWMQRRTELHAFAGAASNFFGAIGPTPIDLLNTNWKAVWTSPQTTTNEMQLFGVNGRFDLSREWSLTGSLSTRWFEQTHLDGNPGDFAACDPASSAPGALCLDASGFPTPPAPVPAAWFDQFILFGPNGRTLPFLGSANYGTIDSTRTETQTFSGSVQATNKMPLFGRPNTFVTGLSVDFSNVRFRASTELDILNADFSAAPSAAVPGTGSTITNVPNPAIGAQFTVDFEPVDLGGHPTYSGFYAVDTLDVAPRLSATAGVRLNAAQITTTDNLGTSPELNAQYSYARANPMAGLSWRIGATTNAYAGYSESNRIPTTLELDCSNPVQPCVLANSLVPDPPLAQVVSHTYELGVRDNASTIGRLHWSAALFRTDSDNDIVSVASVVPGFSYYTNVPLTRRQGIELGAHVQSHRWLAYANYSFTDATYQFAGTLSSPNNPSADANGNVSVVPGDRIPGIPAQQLKVGWDYAPEPAWHVGADVLAVSSQYYAGDDANQNAMLPAYLVVDLHGSYQLAKHVELFGIVNNVFNARYATYGTYFDTSSVPSANLTDPRTITPAAPISGYAGIRLRW